MSITLCITTVIEELTDKPGKLLFFFGAVRTTIRLQY